MKTEPVLVTILRTNDMRSRLEAMSKLSSSARQHQQQLETGGRSVLQFRRRRRRRPFARFRRCDEGRLSPASFLRWTSVYTALGTR